MVVSRVRDIHVKVANQGLSPSPKKKVFLNIFSSSPRKRGLHNLRALPQERQNLESRAENARCIRTLTFILALTGRGDRNPCGFAFVLVSFRAKRRIPIRDGCESPSLR